MGQLILLNDLFKSRSMANILTLCFSVSFNLILTGMCCGELDTMCNLLLLTIIILLSVVCEELLSLFNVQDDLATLTDLLEEYIFIIQQPCTVTLLVSKRSPVIFHIWLS